MPTAKMGVFMAHIFAAIKILARPQRRPLSPKNAWMFYEEGSRVRSPHPRWLQSNQGAKMFLRRWGERTREPSIF